MKKLISILIPLIFIFSSLCVQAEDNFDSFVSRTVERWGVPALGVAVISNRKTVFEKTYGTQPCEDDTLFQIGSLSKSFTAALAVRLDEEGVLDLDAPVRDYIENFYLYNDYYSSIFKVSDLMKHNSGLSPYTGNFWGFLGAGKGEMLNMLAKTMPENEPYSGFSYTNLTYLILEQVIENATGRSFEELMYEKILEPLSLDSTSFGSEAFYSSEKHANLNLLPESITSDRHVSDTVYSFPAASGMNSTMNDLKKWLMFNMYGMYGGDIISEQGLKLMHKGDTVISAKGDIVLYAMGWQTLTTPDYSIVYHTGVTFGNESVIAFDTDKQIGIIILSCCSPSPVYELMRAFFDYEYGLTPKLPEPEEMSVSFYEAQSQSLNGEFEGEYYNPVYGTATVEGGYITIFGKKFPIRALSQNTFEFVMPDIYYTYFSKFRNIYFEDDSFSIEGMLKEGAGKFIKIK